MSRLWLRVLAHAFTFILVATAATRPSRIVSTSPSITETLFALGLGERVVGVSSYCRYPSAARSLPKIGTYNDPDPEKIALLRPDLVIIHRSFSTLAERLSTLGIPYAEIQVDSLESVFQMIGDIGKAAGESARAASLNRQVQSRLAALRREAAPGDRPSVLLLVGRTPGLLTDLIAVGRNAYLGQLLEIAGGRNILTETPIPYPHISLETVVRLDPDVILDASFMGETDENHIRQDAVLRRPWLEHRELKAVRNAHVTGLSSEALVTPGPRVVEAVQMIHDAIRGASPSK